MGNNQHDHDNIQAIRHTTFRIRNITNIKSFRSYDTNLSVKDCEDPNPLIRALAVRTMGCIRVDKITEYLCEPLRKCLKDEDPYVRKTAAVCVAKLHDINAQLVEDQGFLDTLKDLISDSNPMVQERPVCLLCVNSARGGLRCHL